MTKSSGEGSSTPLFFSSSSTRLVTVVEVVPEIHCRKLNFLKENEKERTAEK